MLDFHKLIRFFRLIPFRMVRADFYRDLAEMFRRSEPMLSFLEGEITNAQQTGQRSKVFALRRILLHFQSGENAGRIGFLLASVMPRSDSMMLVAVDRAANKAEALEAMAVAIDQQTAMMRLALGYCLMPLAMLPLCYVLIVILSDVIISISKSTPDFVQEELWRGFNGIAKAIAEFTIDFGPLALSMFLTLIIGVIWCLPRWKGMVRLKFEGWPVFSLYRDFQAGLLFTSLAMLLRTGGTLKGSIEDISQASSIWLRWHLRRVLGALDDNPNATIEAFSRGLLSPHLLSRAGTLKRSASTFSDVLIELGTKEGPRVMARVKVAAVTANLALVGALAAVAAVMGLASITVPGQFSTLMQPTNSMTLKAIFESKQKKERTAPVSKPAVHPSST